MVDNKTSTPTAADQQVLSAPNTSTNTTKKADKDKVAVNSASGNSSNSTDQSTSNSLFDMSGIAAMFTALAKFLEALTNNSSTKTANNETETTPNTVANNEGLTNKSTPEKTQGKDTAALPTAETTDKPKTTTLTPDAKTQAKQAVASGGYSFSDVKIDGASLISAPAVANSSPAKATGTQRG